MRPIATAVMRAGLVDDDLIAEMKHWGFIPRNVEAHPFETVDEAISAIDDAIHGEEQIRLRKTDLDLLRLYLNKDKQIQGRLVIVDTVADTRANKPVTFCILPGRRYAIPWMGDSPLDLLVNGDSYLTYHEKDNPGSRRAYFSSYEEISFGEVQAFMVLEASHVQ